MRLTSRAPSTPALSSPPANRHKRPGWLDVRLWAGILLVLASTFVGARLMMTDTSSARVWKATRDMGIGVPISESDLVAVTVDQSVAAMGYASARELPTGTIVRPIAAGELIPMSALGNAASTSMRQVTIPIDPGHFPPALIAGELVDIWVTHESSGGVVPPHLVLESVLTRAVSSDGGGMGGQAAVVVDVPEDAVGDVVGSVRGGVVDLIAVPLASQTLTSDAPVAS